MNEFVGSADFTLIDAVVLGVGCIFLVISIILFMVSKRRKTNLEMINQVLSDPEILEIGTCVENTSKKIRTDVEKTSQDLETTKQELASLKKKLFDTESDLEDAQYDLEAVKKELKKKKLFRLFLRSISPETRIITFR